MIIKINNKQQNFYQYMGKIFGSRLLESETNDRIYDDDNKEWYVYIEDEKVRAFVSISKNVIKNIYSIREIYLEELLNRIKKENTIEKSIVPNKYLKIYKRCDFQIDENKNYKNFVKIFLEKVG